MKRLILRFAGPRQVVPVEEEIPSPAADQVLVETMVSAISTGTELLIYRGQWPENLPIDETIHALDGTFAYPVKYGYAAVGSVTARGTDVHPDWLGRMVFAFNPHESHFLASPDHLLVVPDSLSAEESAFLPNMETAVNFLMDGRPLIGESVVVFGQGVVGLLTAALLARFPLGQLVTVDTCPLRRRMSVRLGANEALDPLDPAFSQTLAGLLTVGGGDGGADLTYEVSGNPGALDQAVAATGFSGRIVIGSWYGTKPVTVDLGGSFHRARIRMVSSQVSTLSPELSGRWTKPRRLRAAMRLLEEVRPAALITHRFHVSRAAEAYRLLDEEPDQAVQIMLTYKESP